MKNIGPKDSTQELLIRKLVYKLGYRFRLHKKDLPGKPDLVFLKYKKVIFVNGCFWHSHAKCNRSKLPTTRKKFWKEKIENNKKRDKSNKIKLKKMGWDYLVIWQCDIKKRNTEKLSKNISTFLS